MTPPRTRAPARPYRKPTVRGEATAQQVRSLYAVMTEPRPGFTPCAECRALVCCVSCSRCLLDGETPP